MNYILLLPALVAAAVALLYTGNILRVAFGRTAWASHTAFYVHLVVAPTAVVLTIWLFGLAVPR